jgi:enoyl-CoA hydratase
MDFTQLKYEQENGVGLLTITRPNALNALNGQFFKEFNLFLDQIENDKALRVLILTGEGKAFVAGADIAEMQNMGQKEGYEFSKIGQNTFERLENLSIIVIGAINGFALGGGCELAMACDFRIASEKAKFGMPEVSLGLIPGYGGTQRLSRLVGLGNSLFLTLTGQMFDAAEAHRLGLVQKISEPDSLLSDAKQVAAKIIGQGPNAVKAAKTVIRSGIKTDITSGFNIESDWFGRQFTGDGIEGMKAFLEKRKPYWD